MPAAVQPSGANLPLDDYSNVTPFILGGVSGKAPSPNALIGSITVGTGTVVVNAAGTMGLVDKSAISSAGTFTFSSGGDVMLSANLNAVSTTSATTIDAVGNILSTTTSAKISGNQVSLFAGGNIEGPPIKAVENPLVFAGNTLIAQSTSGEINLKDSLAKPLLVENSFSKLDFTLNAASSVIGQASTTAGVAITGQDVTVISKGAITNDALQPNNIFAEATNGNIVLSAGTAGIGLLPGVTGGPAPVQVQIDSATGTTIYHLHRQCHSAKHWHQYYQSGKSYWK